ncbi:cupin domain-containing protein [Aquabacter sp. CN5-332]|uniref:cupin domain-containing protein n=1 Tax=Aquabacter sp. CN5-332 TaxID=3156608 RepID=UPI0032B3ED30
MENVAVNEQGSARTPGAHRAQRGEYVFDMRRVNEIMGGPEYSPVYGGCVEGDRMIVALMRAPAGKMGEPHSHPNEQWIFVLEGEFEIRLEGQTHRVGPGNVVYVPANTIHQGGACAGQDVMFFTCKDSSHGLHGMKYIS